MRTSIAALSILMVSVGLAQPVPPEPPTPPTPPSPPAVWKGTMSPKFAFQYQGDQAYDRGLRALDSRRWDDALDSFAKVSADASARADGALHWKAYSLHQLGRRDDALAALADLKKSYAASRWLPEAQALESAIKRGGGKETDAEIEEDLKLLALNGLVQSDPDRAAPLVEELLKTSPSRRLRERALAVVARAETTRSQALLVQVARGTVGNPDLQVRAIRHLGSSRVADHRPLLSEIYLGSKDPAVKKAVVDGLSAQESAPALVALARKETDPEMRREMVRRLSRMRSKEANDFMAELLK